VIQQLTQWIPLPKFGQLPFERIFGNVENCDTRPTGEGAWQRASEFIR